MRFLDLTKTPSVERKLSLFEIQALIKQETGRLLVFEFPGFYEEKAHYFKLVRWPDPIGFGLVAAQEIPEMTLLCGYGGEKRFLADVVRSGDTQNSYIQRIHDENGAELCLDGKQYGDLGCLFAHSPAERDLHGFGISEKEAQLVQTSNVAFRGFSGQYFFYSTRNIPAGAVISHDYGYDYWEALRISPSLFQKNTMCLIDLSGLTFSGKAHIYRDPNDGELFTTKKNGIRNIISSYTASLLFLCQILLQANATAIALNSAEYRIRLAEWLMLVANAKDSGIKLSVERCVKQSSSFEVLLEDADIGSEFAFSPDSFMPVITDASRRVSNEHPYCIKITKLAGFFHAREVERYVQNTQVQDCEPPPGSQIYKGRTIMPNPLIRLG